MPYIHCYVALIIMEMKTKEIWKAYSETDDWKNVNKTHENIFCMGVQSVLLRGEKLLQDYLDSIRKDEWSLLYHDQEEQLVKGFGEWCSHNAT